MKQPKQTKSSDPAKTTTPTFEQALTRLEEIVEAVENGDATLEDAMALYKEGLALSKICGDMLNHYEAEITMLTKEADGVFTQKSFTET